jgi:hypothetical protein
MIKKLIEKWYREDEDTYHFRVSVLKSALRILAGVSLIAGSIAFAGVLLIIAEVLGIVEEL